MKETAKCWVGIKAGSMIKFLMLDIDHDSKHLIKGYKSGRLKLIIKLKLSLIFQKLLMLLNRKYYKHRCKQAGYDWQIYFVCRGMLKGEQEFRSVERGGGGAKLKGWGRGRGCRSKNVPESY